MLPNIHIDVRVVFDENIIFVPKQQFKLGLIPDIYAVLKLSSDLEHAEFLGFFQSKEIEFSRDNEDYYFFPKSKLIPPEMFIRFVKDYNGNTNVGISEGQMLRGKELSILLADHDLTNNEYKEFMKFLISSNDLRDSVLEYDNFETLSYKVAAILAGKDYNNL